MTDHLQDFVSYQKSLFELFSDFFQRASGVDTPEHFATFDSFSKVVNDNSTTLAQPMHDALVWADENIRPFYVKESAAAHSNARQLGGLKLIQGGGSGFLSTHLASVRGSLLYADTVLIPDPVLPWFETDRSEEKFRHVKLFQAIFAILHLKPLIDANLRIPPVCIFPSFEKSLESNDAVTKQKSIQLVTDVFAHYIDPGLQQLNDVLQFANNHSERFIEKVGRANLFVAPGGPIGEPINDALERYLNDRKTWLSSEYLTTFCKLPTHVQILYGIIERIIPQYHLLENADELASYPLVAIDQQAHYLQIVANMSNARLTYLQVLNPAQEALAK